MKKHIFGLLLTGAAALVASAAQADDSYLYWMVDLANPPEYKVAAIKAFKSGEADQYLTLYTPDNLESGVSSISQGVVADWNNAGAGLYASLGATGSGWSYVIELWNDSTFAGQSDVLDYSGVQQYLAYTTGSSTPPIPASMWTVTSVSVPEPNSVLLMALGFAAMALRRRNLIKA